LHYRLHPSSIRCRGLNPRPLGHEPSALATSPWLLANLNDTLCYLPGCFAINQCFAKHGEELPGALRTLESPGLSVGQGRLQDPLPRGA